MILLLIQALFGLVTAVYIITPILFKCSKLIQHSLLFMNRSNVSNFERSTPESLKLREVRALRLINDTFNSTKCRLELGVWHIPPLSKLKENRRFNDKNAFADSRPIILYLHGNKGDRASEDRVKLYKRLAEIHDFHVITFDYRGYGDSTYIEPTRDGLCSDARFMYKWLLEQPRVSKDRVVVWGHSLGTGVATEMVANLPDDWQPRRLILEAPFDSVANAVRHHPWSAPFRLMPYFDYFFTQTIRNSPELNFDSLNCMRNIKQTPIMIIHAEDDAVIPIQLGENLYRKAIQLGNSRVEFLRIAGEHRLGHKYISSHKETMLKVDKFIEF